MSKRLVMAASPGTGLFMTNISGKSPKVTLEPQEPTQGSKTVVEELEATKQLLGLAQRRCYRLEMEKQKQIEALEKKATTAESKCKQMESAHELSDHRYESLRSENARLEADLETQRAESSMMERRYLQAKAELNELRNESDNYEAKAQKWKDEIRKLVDESMDLQEKNVLLEKQLSDIRIERDRLVEEGQRLIAEYEEESEQRLRLEEELACLIEAEKKTVASSKTTRIASHHRMHRKPVRKPTHEPQFFGRTSKKTNDDVEAVRALS